jgi:hypothetical protein
MEKKPCLTRSMLQRTSTLSKQSSEQRISFNLNGSILNKIWRRQGSTNSDTFIINPIFRPLTYALEPQRKFDFSRAQKLLQLELNRRCEKISKKLRYDPKLSADFIRDLTQQLYRVIKTDYPNYIRYKIVLLVSILQTTPNRQIHQSVKIVSRCLWNRDTDGSITVQTKLGYDMLAIATVFAVYTD